MAESTTDNGAGTQNGQSMVVGQIRTPPTPFDSDMNPLYNFQFSGSEKVVTVKDVEEIVSAIKESFSRFIETQRSYLDAMNQSKTVESAQSEDSGKNSGNSDDSGSYAYDSKNVDAGSSSGDSRENGLTNPPVSDIIQEHPLEDGPSFEGIQSSLDGIKDDLSSAFEGFSDEITEKLLEGPDENGETDEVEVSPLGETKEDIENGLMSLSDYMASSFGEIRDGIDGRFSGFEEDLSEEGNGSEETLNEGFNGEIDTFSAIVERQTSMADVLNEANESVKRLLLTVGNIEKSITGFSGDGLARSMAGLLSQDAAMRSVSTASVSDKVQSPIESIGNMFGDAFEALGNALVPRVEEQKSEEEAPKGGGLSDVPILGDLSNWLFGDERETQTEGKEEDETPKPPSEESSEKEGLGSSLFGFVSESFGKITSLFSGSEEEKGAEATHEEGAEDNEAVEGYIPGASEGLTQEEFEEWYASQGDNGPGGEEEEPEFYGPDSESNEELLDEEDEDSGTYAEGGYEGGPSEEGVDYGEEEGEEEDEEPYVDDGYGWERGPEDEDEEDLEIEREDMPFDEEEPYGEYVPGIETEDAEEGDEYGPPEGEYSEDEEPEPYESMDLPPEEEGLEDEEDAGPYGEESPFGEDGFPYQEGAEGEEDLLYDGGMSERLYGEEEAGPDLMEEDLDEEGTESAKESSGDELADIKGAVDGNREYARGRFDKLESLLGEMASGGVDVPEPPPDVPSPMGTFETERIG